MRTVQWGHWAISFLRDGNIVATYQFPVGPHGPASGTLGSALYRKHQDMCERWINTGDLPKKSTR